MEVTKKTILTIDFGGVVVVDALVVLPEHEDNGILLEALQEKINIEVERAAGEIACIINNVPPWDL